MPCIFLSRTGIWINFDVNKSLLIYVTYKVQMDNQYVAEFVESGLKFIYQMMTSIEITVGNI